MARTAQRSDQRSEQRVRIHSAATRYEYDRSKQPRGMTYEWKRATVFGQEDTEHMVNLEMNHWQAVPAERHPELSGSRVAPGKQIVRGGLMLMERPEEITQESRELEKFAANNQVASQVQRLGLAGKAGRGIKRSYESTAIHDAVADDD